VQHVHEMEENGDSLFKYQPPKETPYPNENSRTGFSE